jgi:hypothetical protein
VLLKAASGQGDPLHPSLGGTVQRPHVEPASLSMLGLHLQVVRARVLAVVGLVLAVATGATGAVAMLFAGKGDEAAQIRFRYADLLLDVSGGVPAQVQGAVEMARMEDLVKAARQDGRMILHQDHGQFHSYLVTDGQIGYLYRTRPQALRGAIITPSEAALRV